MPRTPSPHQRDRLFMDCLDIQPPKRGYKYQIHSRRQDLEALIKEQSHLKIMPELPINANKAQLTRFFGETFSTQSLIMYDDSYPFGSLPSKGIDTLKYLLETFSGTMPLLHLAPVIYVAPESGFLKAGTFIEEEFGKNSRVLPINRDYIDPKKDGLKLSKIVVRQRSEARKLFENHA